MLLVNDTALCYSYSPLLLWLTRFVLWADLFTGCAFVSLIGDKLTAGVLILHFEVKERQWFETMRPLCHRLLVDWRHWKVRTTRQGHWRLGLILRLVILSRHTLLNFTLWNSRRRWLLCRIFAFAIFYEEKIVTKFLSMVKTPRQHSYRMPFFFW